MTKLGHVSSLTTKDTKFHEGTALSWVITFDRAGARENGNVRVKILQGD
jgi:hypothetical protein